MLVKGQNVSFGYDGHIIVGKYRKNEAETFYTFALFWFIETMRNFNIFDKYKRNSHA